MRARLDGKVRKRWPEDRKGVDWFEPINASPSALVTKAGRAGKPCIAWV
jgi:hypothetical protein